MEKGNQNLDKTEEQQQMCFQCDINQVDKTIISDLGICRRCHKETLEFLEELVDDRIREGRLMPEISEIIPNKLYLGNQDASLDIKTLEQYKITHILVAGAALRVMFGNKFKYHQININDAVVQEIKSYFEECIQFIQNGGVVFVHCHAGISRSSSIVIAYIMKTQKLKFQQAFDLVKQKRNEIKPNSGFINQLREYEQQLFGQ